VGGARQCAGAGQCVLLPRRGQTWKQRRPGLLLHAAPHSPHQPSLTQRRQLLAWTHTNAHRARTRAPREWAAPSSPAACHSCH
jgi:hypothetical protein